MAARLQTAQGGGDGSQGTSVAAIFGSNVTLGSLVLVCVRNSSDTLTGVSDSLGTSYSLANSITSVNPRLWLYYGYAPATGANTITCTFSSTSDVWVFGIELSGMAASSPLDVTSTNTYTGVTDITTGPFSTAQADEYVVMFASQSSALTYTAGATFTLVDGTIPTNPSNFGGVQEQITGAILSSFTAHITSSGTTIGAVLLAAFKGGEPFFGRVGALVVG